MKPLLPVLLAAASTVLALTPAEATPDRAGIDYGIAVGDRTGDVSGKGGQPANLIASTDIRQMTYDYYGDRTAIRLRTHLVGKRLSGAREQKAVSAFRSGGSKFRVYYYNNGRAPRLVKLIGKKWVTQSVTMRGDMQGAKSLEVEFYRGALPSNAKQVLPTRTTVTIPGTGLKDSVAMPARALRVR